MMLRVAGETVRTMALCPNPLTYPGDRLQHTHTHTHTPLIGLGGYRSFLGSRGRGFEHCKVLGFASGKLLLAPPTRHISQEAFGLSVASGGHQGGSGCCTVDL